MIIKKLKQKHINKNPYEEYLINENYLKKIYNMYINQSIFEKFIEFLIFLAMFFITIGFFLETFSNKEYLILVYIHKFFLVILVIFILEILINYLKSKSFREFFKKNWIDFILILFLNIYFLFIKSIIVFRIYFFNFKPLLFKIKSLRIATKLLKKIQNKK